MVSFDGGLQAKSMTSQRYRATYKMADMRYYDNVMTTTRWRLYVIVHLQQYSRRLNLFFCTITNKYTIISQIITLLHVSTLSCHAQTAYNQYLAKLHKYFKSSCRLYNLQLRFQQLHLKYFCNLTRY